MGSSFEPGSRRFIKKAREDLAEARLIATLPLAKAAARSAYYATFHAAEALITERTGKIAKTHSGVRSEFSRLLKASGLALDLLPTLAAGYRFEEISDYGLAPTDNVTPEDATEMIGAAARFIDVVETLLSAAPPA